MHIVSESTFADEVVEPVLDCVFCSASEQASDATPLLANSFLFSQQQNVFFIRPLSLCLVYTVQFRVQMIVPPFATVLAFANLASSVHVLVQ